MPPPLPLLLIALSTALAAPAALYDDYPVVTVPQKRAALVLDRLLVALQKALREDEERLERPDRDGPRTAPLRLAALDDPDMMVLREEIGGVVAPPGFQLGPRAEPLRLSSFQDNTSALQRRGQAGSGRGRVLRCYFNAVTCF